MTTRTTKRKIPQLDTTKPLPAQLKRIYRQNMREVRAEAMRFLAPKRRRPQYHRRRS